MHAYLITGGSQETRQKKAQELAKKHKTTLVEFNLQKIDDTRSINDFVKLSPGRLSGMFIKDIDRATTESANAFLKNLEEKESYLFILTASNKNQVLPTIVSRCQVVKAEEGEHDFKEVKSFLKASTATRLLMIEEYKGRAEAQDFTNSLLLYGNTMLKVSEDKEKSAVLLKKALLLKRRLSANTNPLLQLTSFVTSLDERS